VTQTIAVMIPGDRPATVKLAYTAAGVAFAVYLVNFILSFFMTEPAREKLPE
jgi:hypothetical protein